MMHPLSGIKRYIKIVVAAIVLCFLSNKSQAFARVKNSYQSCNTSATVTSLSDNGSGSLRDAIQNACSGGTIEFDGSLAGGTITLTSGQLTIDKELSILNPNAPGLTIDGNGTSRIFFISNGADATIEDLTITNGDAGGGFGGGIYVNDASLTLRRSTLSNNNAFAGGGLRSEKNSSVVTIINSSFINNQTPSEGGGGINNDVGAEMTITGSTISGNSGLYAGGIANYNGATMTITNSTISGNTCTDTGGISGGGIENYDDNNGASVLTVINSTITNNSCPDDGANSGGIYNNAIPPTLTNTIVAGNSGANPDLSGDFSSGGHNLIGDATGSTGFTDAVNGDQVGSTAAPLDSMLDALADNGGLTNTHALLPGSPAIDAGDNTGVPATDQRGDDFPRIANGVVDIGAYECHKSLTVSNTSDDGSSSLREMIKGICSGGTIEFDGSLAGGTITLTSGQLTIDKELSILNPNAPGLIIDGNNSSRIFDITSTGVATIEDLTITNGNSGSSFGGGIRVIDGQLTLRRSRLSNNEATVGGGLRNQRGTVTVVNSTITGNQAPSEGGGGINNDVGAEMIITGSTISGNSGLYAGGIANYNGATMTITNSTISGNTCTDTGGISGGGIENFDDNNGASVLTVINSTITNNSCPDDGANSGGIYNNAIPPTLTNTIVAGNSGANPDLSGDFSSGGHNLIGDATGSTGFTDGVNGDQVGSTAAPLDPMLAALADNGGLTNTHALLPGSPAIDAGDNSVDSNLFPSDDLNNPVDQRGSLRFQGSAVDIGAFESDAHFINLTGNEGFRMLTAPVTTTLYDLLEPIWTQGQDMTWADHEGGDPNVWMWDKNSADDDRSNWIPVDNLKTTTLEAGDAVLVYVFEDDEYGTPGSWPKTLSVSGSTHSLPVSPTINPNAGGFTLLGNPTSASIAWNDMDRTRVDDAVYVWDPNNGTTGGYRTWSGGAGDLSDGIIRPFQGFFVRTSSGTETPAITIDKTAKPGQFYGKQPDDDPYTIRLYLEGEGLKSSTWLLFTEEGRSSMDKGDALKLQPLSDDYSILASKIDGQTLLDINHLPLPQRGEVTIPITAQSTRNGTYTIGLSNQHLPDFGSWRLELMDQKTGMSVTLSEGQEYRFDLNTVDRKTNKISPFAVQAVINEESRFLLLIKAKNGSSKEELPEEFALFQNYPNPFNPVTTIQYQLPEPGQVLLDVYDLTGRKVSTLADKYHNAGTYTVQFDASNLSSGIYIYTLQAEGRTLTRKLTLIK